jgi:ABC-type glycerol-3-phosphate transport system substrate-binding protein
MAFVVKCTEDICGGRDNVEEFQMVHATPDGQGPYWMFPYHRTGVLLYGNWLSCPIGILNPDMPVNLGGLPGGPSDPGTKHVLHGGTMVSIPSKAAHWELAWEFLKYMSSQDEGDGVRFIQECGDDISGNIAEAKSAEAMEFAGRPKMIALFEDAKTYSYLPSPISHQWNDEMYRMADKILLKEQTIPEALAFSQNEVQKFLDDYWATA